MVQNLQIHTIHIVIISEQSKLLSFYKEVDYHQRALALKQEVKQRIVNIGRPYIRPIVRGKENKCVEFGAKVNNIQNDGLSFMEHHFFESIQRGRDDKGVHWVSVGTDWYKSHQSRCRHHLCQQRKPAICTQNGITTCFDRKAPSQRMKMQV